MVPCKFQSHLIRNHPQHKAEPNEYFEMLEIYLEIRSKRLKKVHSIPEKVHIDSDMIVQQKKSTF